MNTLCELKREATVATMALDMQRVSRALKKMKPLWPNHAARMAFIKELNRIMDDIDHNLDAEEQSK